VSLFCSRGGDRALLFAGLAATAPAFAPGAGILHKADVVSRGPRTRCDQAKAGDTPRELV